MVNRRVASTRRTVRQKACGVLIATSIVVASLPGKGVAAESSPKSADQRVAAATRCTRVGQTRLISGRTQVCKRSGRRNVWVTKQGPLTTTTTAVATTPSRPLGRSAIDRPGANTADIKFIYVTFKDGPDSNRDSNGQIAAMASEVNRYFRSQFPGKQLRYDTFNGQIDVQHVRLPMTNKDYNDIWLNYAGGYPTIDNVMSDMMRDAGFSWTSGFLTGNYDDQYATGQWHTNDRGYVLIFEGSRGPKQHNGEWQNLVCKHWDHEYSGIVMRYLRDLNGDVCPNTLDTTWPLAQNGLYKWWGFDVAKGIITLLTLMPGCDRVTKAELARPGNERINEGVPDTDMASMAARYGGAIGSKSIAKLDSARNRYFKIDNGPHVGDRCYDIQYSPIWEDVRG
jgi:hypothetical protein